MSLVQHEEDCFWMVWNPAGHAPTHRHTSERSAVNEAERLARANQGAEFFVLVASHKRCVDAMQRIRLTEEMPF